MLLLLLSLLLFLYPFSYSPTLYALRRQFQFDCVYVIGGGEQNVGGDRGREMLH